jgi:hypothetical protein
MLNLFFSFLFLFQSKDIIIVDFGTNKPIPFASFTSLKDGKGGYADENGRINFNGDANESFIVSCTGYLPDTVNFIEKTVSLKPLVTVLPTIKVTAKKGNIKTKNLGFFKKSTRSSWLSSFKDEFYTFIPNPDTATNWQIKSIKLALHGQRNGQRKGDFQYFKIRPHLRDTKGKFPNNELVKNDITIDVYKGERSVIIELNEPILLPKNGCFVGFEQIGYSIENNKFIPYSDYANKSAEEKVFINIPMLKANSQSAFRARNGKAWAIFDKDTEVFAFGLEVLY